jgi:hypothetical protein
MSVARPENRPVTPLLPVSADGADEQIILLSIGNFCSLTIFNFQAENNKVFLSLLIKRY